MQNKRDLFKMRRHGRILAFAVRGRGPLRNYVGSIDGEECVTAHEKGELLRLLLAMSNPRHEID